MNPYHKALLIVLSVFVQASSHAAQQAFQLSPLIKDGIEDPLFIAPVPGEPGSHWILEQAGRIKKIKNGQLESKLVLDIARRVKSGGEMGLLGLAFHPQFTTNRRFFLNYNPSGDSLATVVGEFNADTLAETILLKYDQPYSNHKGGMLAFDSHGDLYISAGDGGSGGDPHNNGQSLDTLLGKILRINVDKGDPYGIPKDNPLVGKTGRPEVFAWGLRNPWRFSFDRKTGLLFAGDVGQDKFEEIDIVEKGRNYGWSVWEGTHCFRPAKNCSANGMTPPLIAYGRSEGISVTGGYVYRGTKMPELDGVYIYGDYGSGKIWGLSWDPTTKKAIKNTLLLNSHLPISSFGEDYDGELLVVSYAGVIYRLEAGQQRK